MARPSIEKNAVDLMNTALNGKQIIQDLHDKKAELNSELHHDRNLKLQTVAITTAFWFAIVGTFLLGTRF